jgi:SAM-dependent methyltransferase
MSTIGTEQVRRETPGSMLGGPPPKRSLDDLITGYFSGSGFRGLGYWREDTRHAARASANLLDRLLELAPPGDGVILEIGCGTGAGARHLSRNLAATRIIGASSSPRDVAACRAAMPECSFLRMDPGRLPVSDGAVDTVICVEASLQMGAPSAFLREAHRALSPGGHLLLSDVLSRADGADEYERLCRDAGFEDARLVDATRDVWEASFWHAVRFAHAEFLAGEIDQACLFAFLERFHRLAEILDRYILLAATKSQEQHRPVPARAPVAPSVDDPQDRFTGGVLPPRSRRRSKPGSPIDEPARRLARGYDSVMYWPPLLEYYRHSDFVNFGYWDETTRDAREASEKLVEQLLAFLPEKRGRILDVACGKGATTRHLQRHYPASAITGINISERQLASCRENAPGSTFMLMDATDLKFADESFDDMICVEAAFHFKTRERFFEEARRVLKPGGRLVLCDILLTREAEARRPGRHSENHLVDLDAYADLARRKGFDQIEVVDATKACFDGAFWHLVHYGHEKLLARDMTTRSLRHFCSHILEFVPDFQYYVLASLKRT